MKLIWKRLVSGFIPLFSMMTTCGAFVIPGRYDQRINNNLPTTSFQGSVKKRTTTSSSLNLGLFDPNAVAASMDAHLWWSPLIEMIGTLATASADVAVSSINDIAQAAPESPPYTLTELELQWQPDYPEAFIDVPDNFFTFTFFCSGLLLSITRAIARTRLEERAFELRIKDQTSNILTWAEQQKLIARISEAKNGKNDEKWGDSASAVSPSVVRSQKRDPTMLDRFREFTLSDSEIADLESLGITYDPYYDDPYTEKELPEFDEETKEPLTFRKDAVYGDRIYDNGEVFYLDKESGLYYRQGAKPRKQPLFAW